MNTWSYILEKFDVMMENGENMISRKLLGSYVESWLISSKVLEAKRRASDGSAKLTTREHRASIYG